MEQLNIKDNFTNIINNNNKSNNINNINLTKMLQSMLKNILDIKLINLEKNSNKQFSMLKLTLSNTKYITKITSDINKGIKKNNSYNINVPKLNRNKFSKSVKKMNVLNSNLVLERTDNKIFQRMKSESKKSFFEKNKAKNNISINKNELIIRSPSKIKKHLDNSVNRSKFNSYNNFSLNKFITSSNKLNKTNKKNIKFFHTRNHKSIDSNITSENSTYRNNNKHDNTIKNYKYKGNSLDQASYKKSSSRNKKLGLIGKLKQSIEKFKEEKNNCNKKGSLIKDKKKEKNNNNNNNNNNNIKRYGKKKDCKKINKELIIKNLENNWKKEEKLINKDPLLINAMKDLEFIPKELISINISRDELSMYINKSKDTPRNDINDNIQDKNHSDLLITNSIKKGNSIFIDYLPNILLFLSLSDIIQIKNCSKEFHSYILNYYLKIFEIDKTHLIEKKNKLNLKEGDINQNLKIDFIDLNLTKGTLKAIKLLNEDIFSRLFSEKKTPKKDILLVYKIYFLLINYDEIINNNNISLSNDIFWEKCRNYFLINKGIISDILINNIKEKKLILNNTILYRIYKLYEKNTSKLCSAYYSKLCGTTSLFIFYIKDILDFLGFSNEIKYQKNAYYIYFEIIEYLGYKINILNSFSKT